MDVTADGVCQRLKLIATVLNGRSRIRVRIAPTSPHKHQLFERCASDLSVAQADAQEGAKLMSASSTYNRAAPT